MQKAHLQKVQAKRTKNHPMRHQEEIRCRGTPRNLSSDRERAAKKRLSATCYMPPKTTSNSAVVYQRAKIVHSKRKQLLN